MLFKQCLLSSFHSCCMPCSCPTWLWSFSGSTFIWLLLYMFSLASISYISACVCVCSFFLFGQVSRSVFGPAGVLASCELPNGHYIKHENCSACWQFSSFSLCALRVVYCFVYVLSQFGFISVFVFTLSIASCPPFPYSTTSISVWIWHACLKRYLQVK